MVYKDKFLVIEKKDLLELIEMIKFLETELTTFKSNLEKSKFKLLVLQQKEIVDLNDYGNYVSKKRQFMVVFLSNSNYETNNPFDFSKSIKLSGFNFNIDYKDVFDIDGKDLKIKNITYTKDDNGKLKAKISVGLNSLKVLTLNYLKLKENYFTDWKGNFPNSDGDSFYYYLEAKPR
jgi:mRNA-degrading endonuclease HigB of HigAB toxin-antitoxin module